MGFSTKAVAAAGALGCCITCNAFVPATPGVLRSVDTCRRNAESVGSRGPSDAKSPLAVATIAGELRSQSNYPCVTLRQQQQMRQQQRRLLHVLRSTSSSDDGDNGDKDDESSDSETPPENGDRAGKSFSPGSWESGAGKGKDVGDPATRTKLKADLIRKVATINRGFVAQESDRVSIEETIEMLELENPNPTPCEGFKSGSSPIEGRWQLLYTTSLDVLSLQINPAVTIGQILQDIDADGRGIKNIIELQPPFAAVTNRIAGSSLATLTVILESEPVSDTRIDLTFKRTEIQANSFLGRELDLPALGVDIPSGEKLQQFLSKGKKTAANAKSKAKKLAERVKKARQQGSSKADVDVKNADDGAPEVTTDADEDGDGDKDEALAETTTGSSSSSSVAMKPYFETTYVDDELRVGRTGQGDVYVSARVS